MPNEEVRYPLSLNILAGAGEALLCSAYTLSHRQWVAEDKNFYANTRLFRCARAPQTF